MCNCNKTIHFRNTCWIKTEGYKNCPMLYYNTLLRIFEDYKLNNKIYNKGFDSIKEYIMDTCNFNHNDWKHITELYYNSYNSIYNKKLLIQNNVPFQYTPECSNIQ